MTASSNVSDLSSSDASVRVRALRHHLQEKPTSAADGDALRTFVHLAARHDASPEVRQEAVLQAHESIAADALRDPHPNVRLAALSRVPTAAVAQHLAIETDEAVVVRAVEISQQVLPALLTHPAAAVRNAIAEPLAKQGRYPELVKLLRPPSDQAALLALKKHPPRVMTERMVAKLLGLAPQSSLAVEILSLIPCSKLGAYAMVRTWLETAPLEVFDAISEAVAKRNETFHRVLSIRNVT